MRTLLLALAFSIAACHPAPAVVAPSAVPTVASAEGGTPSPDVPDAPEVACDARDLAGCYDRAVAFFEGNGVPQSYGRAGALFEYLCERGELRACHQLGFMFQTGKEGTPDHPRAVALFKKACDGGRAASCSNLGLIVLEGQGTSSAATAADLFRRGCDAHDALGCGALGGLYYQGTGVAQDFARAAELYKISCEGGNASACGRLGLMLSEGEKGVPKDTAAALRFLSASCVPGAEMGCFAAGTFSETLHEDGRAAAFYRRACDAGIADGCQMLEKLTAKKH